MILEQFFVRICAEAPMVFSINGHQIGWIEHEYDILEIKTDEDFILSCYPTTQTNDAFNLSFSAKINILAGKLVCTHPNIIITDFSRGNFLITVSPYTIPSNTVACEQFYQTLGELSFAINKNILNVSNGKNGLYYPLTQSVYEIKIAQNGDLIELSGQTTTKKSFSLFINNSMQVQFDGLADKIEYDGTQIITLQNISDIARHGLVTIYKRTQNGFKKTQQYSVYTQNEPIAPASSEALPLAFMEALNIKNYTLARSYLHPTLSTSLNETNMTAYFGDFIEATPSTFSPYNLTLIYNGNPRFVKTYHFKIKENRIFDIDMVS